MNNKFQLMNKILDHDNLTLAIKRVRSNKGSAGIDNMSIKEMDKFVKSYEFTKMIEEIRMELYSPSPVKMVEIPKPDGGVRMLGIPTIKDRIIQQAINQVLTKIYDCQFSEYSYGFRPNKGAHDALAQAEKYVQEERIYIVDIDLSKFFDTIDRNKLIHLLKQQIEDTSVIALIWKYLNAGMMKGNYFTDFKTGTPQGSPLSPLLSNIYLDQVDKELERRGIKFCRYADDIQIYATSIKGAHRTMENTIKLLESKRIKLIVNNEKSAVRPYYEAKFLGYSFRFNNYKVNKIVLSIHPKSMKRFYERCRQILKRNRGISIEMYIKELNQYTIGWFEYYRLAISNTFALKIDGYLRTKIRVILWKHWKTSKQRIKMQRKHGRNKTVRGFAANSSRGMYNVARHQLCSSLTIKVIEEYYKFTSFQNLLQKKRDKIVKELNRCIQLQLDII